MKKKRPVLQDVADRVGVTKMTVSRFLRNPEQVSVALRGKIAAALDELGYIPNRAPDILSNATSRAIGVLLPSLTNQVFAEVLRGIEAVTDAHGYQTMLAHYGYKPEMEQERLESMLSWNIDGLILTERTHTPRTLKMIEVAGIPVVELMDSQSPCLDIAVGFDNFEAARQMTAAIIARGHRHIAYLGARLDERTIIKQKGYEQAMRDAGLVPYSVMMEQSSSYSSGMAIAGFHGHDIGQVMEPRLASVLTPRERMGSIGAERLLARIRGETVTPKMLDLGFTLSPGGSI
ncbi:gluconate operon transcriptional repressor GntR [Salmonella enterica]|nr:gluconate operon transcriptional repressor GntR [Salmonella enterica]